MLAEDLGQVPVSSWAQNLCEKPQYRTRCENSLGEGSLCLAEASRSDGLGKTLGLVLYDFVLGRDLGQT